MSHPCGGRVIWLLLCALALAAPCAIGAGDDEQTPASDQKDEPAPKADRTDDPETARETAPEPPPCSRTLLGPIEKAPITDMPGREADDACEHLDRAEWASCADKVRALSSQPLNTDALPDLMLDAPGSGWFGAGIGAFLTSLITSAELRPPAAIKTAPDWIYPRRFDSIWLLSDGGLSAESLGELDRIDSIFEDGP